MSRQGAGRTGVVLWIAAVLGAAAVFLGPLTPWMWVDIVGLVVCLLAVAGLAVWFVRR